MISALHDLFFAGLHSMLSIQLCSSLSPPSFSRLSGFPLALRPSGVPPLYLHAVILTFSPEYVSLPVLSPLCHWCVNLTSLLHLIITHINWLFCRFTMIAVPSPSIYSQLFVALQSHTLSSPWPLLFSMSQQNCSVEFWCKRPVASNEIRGSNLCISQF